MVLSQFEISQLLGLRRGRDRSRWRFLGLRGGIGGLVEVLKAGEQRRDGSLRGLISGGLTASVYGDTHKG